MTTTINASPTNGIVQTADGSGVMKLQSNGVTTNAIAWVNFNGTGTVAIRSSYNVSSITDNGTGNYTINFATSLADANYSFLATGNGVAANTVVCIVGQDSASTKTTSALQILVSYNNTSSISLQDITQVNVAVFGN